MKTITLPTGTWLFVKVPKDKEMLSVIPEGLKYLHEDVSGSNGDPVFKTIPLPPGQWQVFSLASAVNEELARKIVYNISYGGFGRSAEEWKNYYGKLSIKTALESFATLMTANGMYLKNPMGDMPNEPTFAGGVKDAATWDYLCSNYAYNLNKWNSHEANVGEWVILKQVKQ